MQDHEIGHAADLDVRRRQGACLLGRRRGAPAADRLAPVDPHRGEADGPRRALAPLPHQLRPVDAEEARVDGDRRGEGALRVAAVEPPEPVRESARVGVRDLVGGEVGVGADIEWSVRSISALEAVTGTPGLVAINPPYGVRIGEADRLRDLYARFGAVMRERFPGWQVYMLSANPRLDAQVGFRFEERLRTRNGGIAVRLVTADVP